MQAHGRKKGKTRVAGHQECGICHPVQKNKPDRGRKSDKLETLSQLRDMSEGERLEVFGHFCKGCGREDNRCPCQRDE